MLYEARQPPRLNHALAVLCAGLSIIGFFVAGIIPSESTAHGAHPLAGLAVIAACLWPAFVFLRRARDRTVFIRADANGLYTRRYSDATIPWVAIAGFRILRFKKQSVLRVKLHDPGAWPCKSRFGRTMGALDNALTYGDFGINPSYLAPGMQALLAALRHYRPDLFAKPTA